MGRRLLALLLAVNFSVAGGMLVLLLAARAAEEPLPSPPADAAKPTPAPPYAAPKGSRFRRTHRSQNFVFWTNIGEADIARLLDVAERTRAATYVRLGVEARPWKKPLPVILCRDAKGLKAASAFAGFPLPPGPRSAGGYYRQGPLVAVVDTPSRRTLTISHEVVHAVMRPLFRGCPAVLHEGLAMSISERLLAGAEALAPFWERHRNWRARWLRRARDDSKIPPLRSLMRYGYTRFHNRNERLHYYLSWCLADVLSDSSEPGQLKKLLKACGAQDGWRALMRVHRDTDIETLWREKIELIAASAK